MHISSMSRSVGGWLVWLRKCTSKICVPSCHCICSTTIRWPCEKIWHKRWDPAKCAMMETKVGLPWQPPQRAAVICKEAE